LIVKVTRPNTARQAAVLLVTLGFIAVFFVGIWAWETSDDAASIQRKIRFTESSIHAVLKGSAPSLPKTRHGTRNYFSGSEPNLEKEDRRRNAD
jgi:hypothetical protein